MPASSTSPAALRIRTTYRARGRSRRQRRRELAEETGLALPDEAETDWVLLEGEGQLAFLRPVRFPETAARLVARIADHLGAEAEPELAGMHVVRGRDDIDAARMPGFVRAYLADAFPPAR